MTPKPRAPPGICRAEVGIFMPVRREAGVRTLRRAQALELFHLVDQEACWENLRRTPAPDPTVAATTADLLSRQRAYEVFRAKLVAYNQRYRPEHVPELLLNTPVRLGTWCRTMRDLCLLVVQDPRCHSPAALVEKAYRCADQICDRLNSAPFGRSTPPGTMAEAIRDLDTVGQWCDALADIASGPLQVPPTSVPASSEVATARLTPDSGALRGLSRRDCVTHRDRR